MADQDLGRFSLADITGSGFGAESFGTPCVMHLHSGSIAGLLIVNGHMAFLLYTWSEVA